MADTIKVTVWNEHRAEVRSERGRKHYPDGMHTVIAEGLSAHDDIEAKTATLDDPQQGLGDEVLDNTDVMIWWGHDAHNDVTDENVDRLQARVLEDGLGLVILHSGHFSKIFKRLMGTTCNLKWREADELERIWVIDRAHPIAHGLGEYFDIPEAEMYGEPFDIPRPDELVLVSWFEGGEIFRSGCCYHRGRGRIFYFRPGHETYPIFYQDEVRRVIANGVRWAAGERGARRQFGNTPMDKRWAR